MDLQKKKLMKSDSQKISKKICTIYINDSNLVFNDLGDDGHPHLDDWR
jgi:hypothetical protein